MITFTEARRFRAVYRGQLVLWGFRGGDYHIGSREDRLRQVALGFQVGLARFGRSMSQLAEVMAEASRPLGRLAAQLEASLAETKFPPPPGRTASRPGGASRPRSKDPGP